MKEGDGGDRISLSLAFNDFVRLYTYSTLIYGYCTVVSPSLSLQYRAQAIQMFSFSFRGTSISGRLSLGL